MELSGRPDEILGQPDALVLDFNLGVKLGNLRPYVSAATNVIL
jgi:hypothetical protein